MYRFQNFLDLIIETNGRNEFDNYFENEYSRINTANINDEPSSHSITLNIVDEIPKDLHPDAIYRKKHFKKLFTFEYSIVSLGTNNVVIYFKDHPVRRLYVTAVGVFVQAQVLEPVMYLSFLKQGVLFMHSAGVSKDGMAYLFPAYGGTGKTTLSLSLLTKGFDFLGDDLIIVDPTQKRVYPYPRPLHIFTYNVRNLKNARIPATTVFFIYFKNVLRFFLERILRTEFLISTRVHADEILKNLRLSQPAKLHNVIFLKKNGPQQCVDLSKEGALELHAAAIANSADLNASLFEILDDQVSVDEVREEEIKWFSVLLQHVDYFGYLNTRLIDLDHASNYLDDVEAR